MPIVLAIEPDRRQAAHLTAIMRNQVKAELLLATTTEGALDAIGNRVPDLVLVPALLSPQDDAALAAALRVIAAAAHVRTLTIPVLASGTQPATEVRGVLAKWRQSRQASPEPDGCEPSVFGEQIATYLREVAAERAELERDADRAAAREPVRAMPEFTADSDVRDEVSTFDYVPEIATFDYEPEAPSSMPTLRSDSEVRPSGQTFDEADAEAEVRPLGQTFESDPEVAQPVQLWARPAVEEIAIAPEEALIDLSEELEELSADTKDDAFEEEPVGVYTIAAEPEWQPEPESQPEQPLVDAFDLLPMAVEPAAPVVAMVTSPAAILQPDAVPVVDTRDEEPLAAAASVAPALFVEPAEPPRADLQPWVPMYLTPGRLWPVLEGMPAETPAPRAEQPDWIELIASLRQDLERRPRPSDGASAQPRRAATPPKPTPKAAKPVQDEWGFFDPEQCGFSTLLAKLEEITDEAPRP